MVVVNYCIDQDKHPYLVVNPLPDTVCTSMVHDHPNVNVYLDPTNWQFTENTESGNGYTLVSQPGSGNSTIRWFTYNNWWFLACRLVGQRVYSEVNHPWYSMFQDPWWIRCNILTWLAGAGAQQSWWSVNRGHPSSTGAMNNSTADLWSALRWILPAPSPWKADAIHNH